MSDRDFFFDPAAATTTMATEVAWGHTERRCDACGKSWGPARCSDPGCASMAFVDTYRPPVFGRLREKLTPKKAVPRASAAQKAAARAMGATVTSVLADLRALDGQLREAVIADVAELQPLQGLLNRVFSVTGDRSLATVDGLGIGLESFIVYLDTYVKQIEETK